MSYEKDWTTWAGDNPQEAEAEMRKERERAEESFARVIRAGLLQPATWGAGVVVEDSCEHEWHLGVCLICEDVDEAYEPTDAQIFAHYGQTKVPGVAV